MSNVKAQIKKELKKVFDGGRVEAMEIFKGFAASTYQTGWHYKDFGRSECHFLGKSFKEVKGYVEEAISMKESC